ncbi:hypothetical protein LNV08_22915, partial [Paucibacter sp. TC2R-5]|uniref:hypothetical protein n=1 Tax=Paucibacter sp. TC2R-5 TaxID=2893555 RepID=UPI0021E37EDD
IRSLQTKGVEYTQWDWRKTSSRRGVAEDFNLRAKQILEEIVLNRPHITTGQANKELNVRLEKEFSKGK